MNCYVHSDREAVGVCVSCGKPICSECKVLIKDKYYCNSCVNKIATIPSDRNESSANTSGQGTIAVIPQEIRGWNWGAFLLSWIWGLGNSVWIALLALIPYVGLIMAIVLGVKGNEWAWQNKRWDSIEHFKRTQSAWAKWGVIVFVASIIVGFIIGISSAI